MAIPAPWDAYSGPYLGGKGLGEGSKFGKLGPTSLVA